MNAERKVDLVLGSSPRMRNPESRFSCATHGTLLKYMTSEMVRFRALEAQWITRSVRPVDHVLEIGPGLDGRLLKAILAAGVSPRQIATVECDPETLATCEAEFPQIRFSQGRFPDWKPANKVDVVTIGGNTLGNQIDREVTWLDGVARCLSPDGRALIGVFGTHGEGHQLDAYRAAGLTMIPPPQGMPKAAAYSSEGLVSRRYSEAEILILADSVASLKLVSLKKVSMGWLLELRKL